MAKAEILLEIKQAEAVVRDMKEAAEAERERIVRDARREALELRESLRKEAEERAAGILRAAEAEIAKEREQVLAGGRRDAEGVKSAGMQNLDRAVEVVASRFQGALNA